jgi:hypothetical protein
VKSEEEVRAIMHSQMMPMVRQIVDQEFDKIIKLTTYKVSHEFADSVKEPYTGYDDNVGMIHKSALFKTIDNILEQISGREFNSKAFWEDTH